MFIRTQTSKLRLCLEQSNEAVVPFKRWTFLQGGATLHFESSQAESHISYFSACKCSGNANPRQVYVDRTTKHPSLTAVMCIHPAVAVISFFTDHVFITEIRVMSSSRSASWVLEPLQVHDISWEPAMLRGGGSMTNRFCRTLCQALLKVSAVLRLFL